MAKGPTTRDFTEQNTARAMQMGNFGMDWMRGVAEQSLNLGKAAFEGYLSSAHKTADSFNHRAAEIRERSVSLANETLSNTFDFASRIVHVKEPQEVFQLQREFLSRQVQTMADQTKEMGQIMAQGMNAASRTTVEQMRGAAE
jgi:hypothetical protein